MAKIIKFKQCHLQEVDGDWETISLIEKEDAWKKNILPLRQYKVVRLFEIKTVYEPTIVKVLEVAK